MQLYFSPLSCAMATRVALYEAEIPATFHRVDLRTGRLDDGSEFRAVNPMGQVPTLRTDEGELLTENIAVLQYVGERRPEAGLVPAESRQRTLLQQWLGFITSELHKVVFYPQIHPLAPEGARAFAREMAGPRFAYVDRHLAGRDCLLDRFTVADCYLVTVLGWTRGLGIDLAPWPNLNAYLPRQHRRPALARAYREELAMYEQDRRAEG